MSESQFSLTHLIGAAAVGLLAGATLVKLSQKPKKKNLLHIVGLKFNEALTEEEIQRHFKEEAKLKERMPGLVLKADLYANLTVSERPKFNKGCTHLCVVELKDEAALKIYGPHPEHNKVKAIQGGRVKSEVVPQLFNADKPNPLIVDIWPADIIY